MKKSLLEQALEIKRGERGLVRDVTDDEIELVIAWLNDEVTSKAIMKVTGLASPNTTMYRIAVVLREAYHRGILKVGK